MVAVELCCEIAEKAGGDAAALWQRLAQASDERGQVRVSAAEWADKLGEGERTIYRRLKALEDAKALKKLGLTSRGVEYRLTWPPSDTPTLTVMLNSGAGSVSLDPEKGWMPIVIPAVARIGNGPAIVNPDNGIANYGNGVASRGRPPDKFGRPVANSGNDFAKFDNDFAKSGNAKSPPVPPSDQQNPTFSQENTAAAASSRGRGGAGARARAPAPASTATHGGGPRDGIRAAAAAMNGVAIEKIDELWELRSRHPWIETEITIADLRACIRAVGADAVRGAIERTRERRPTEPAGFFIRLMQSAIASDVERAQLTERGARAWAREADTARKREALEARRRGEMLEEHPAAVDAEHARRAALAAERFDAMSDEEIRAAWRDAMPRTAIPAFIRGRSARTIIEARIVREITERESACSPS